MKDLKHTKGKEINHKWDFVEGSFNTNETKMCCVPSKKYAEVDLCVKSNGGKGWNIPFAKIKLYSKDLFIDAKETFEDASNLGYEIEKRWNMHNDLLEVCIEALKHHQGGHSEIGHKLRGIIKKATE